MQEFVQILRGLAGQPSAVTVCFQQVDNMHKLVVDQIPYGQIDLKSLVQGSIEVDGPAQATPNRKKPLQWHFGGEPFEICKAIRLQYAYQKPINNVTYDAAASLFIGYELANGYKTEATKIVDAEKNAPGGLQVGSLASQLDAALKAPAALTNANSLIASLKQEFATATNTVTPIAKYVDENNFDSFVDEQFPFTPPAGQGIVPSAAMPAQPTGLSLKLGDKPTDPNAAVLVEYDGPARDYDSKRPFPYTTDTLFNDPSGAYDKLLWWYFGGRAFRITKAMRIAFDNGGMKGSLLIGYQGPGPS